MCKRVERKAYIELTTITIFLKKSNKLNTIFGVTPVLHRYATGVTPKLMQKAIKSDTGVTPVEPF